jgi:hypothetical protein
MGHFAQINEQNIVTQVIVADQDFINTGAVGDPSKWIQTSYNTRGGVHYGSDGLPDGGIAVRKNYAGIGYSFDAGRDAFIPPRPYASWNLNEQTCNWEPPVAMPEDGNMYSWDEEAVNWVEFNPPA